MVDQQKKAFETCFKKEKADLSGTMALLIMMHETGGGKRLDSIWCKQYVEDLTSNLPWNVLINQCKLASLIQMDCECSVQRHKVFDKQGQTEHDAPDPRPCSSPPKPSLGFLW
ncbi:unnamed protein product [Sphenostylis stenocarpa]|uniref:Uncharacterized protein n=1 Tax=Sphenostylis stenocarpa TaxID=92480 RepID=A0AA86W116_9FABA|nr:unnamed protein product [Sphenostylis stenocarpa]